MWIDTFLEAMQAEQGAADNTLAGYRRDLEGFRTWLDAAGIDLALAARGEIEGYLGHLNAAGRATTTRARHLSSVRQFYAFAFTEGWRADNPATGVQGPGKPRRLPKTLDETAVDRLIEAAGSTPGEKGLRLRCLIELLYATGLRVTELVSLPVSAVRGDPRMILVRGKGDRERMVPLSEPAREALSAWLTVRDRDEKDRIAEGGRASPFVFPSRGKSGHLTRVAFFTALKDLARRAGLDPETVSPHTLRHAFATHLLANGADLRAIQTLLGHADISTTEVYTHVLDARLKSLVLEHHPLARDG
ncbi:MAG: site-specific tyrosine recombinase XerD [Pseudomonadota bacterium]